MRIREPHFTEAAYYFQPQDFKLFINVIIPEPRRMTHNIYKHDLFPVRRLNNALPHELYHKHRSLPKSSCSYACTPLLYAQISIHRHNMPINHDYNSTPGFCAVQYLPAKIIYILMSTFNLKYESVVNHNFIYLM